jgi:hypothetical protein
MARKGAKAEKRAALEKGLKGMFKALEGRPTPGRINTLVEQLEDPPKDLSKPKKPGG